MALISTTIERYIVTNRDGFYTFTEDEFLDALWHHVILSERRDMPTTLLVELRESNLGLNKFIELTQTDLT